MLTFLFTERVAKALCDDFKYGGAYGKVVTCCTVFIVAAALAQAIAALADAAITAII